MQRIDLPERENWKALAEEAGFRFHTMHGEPYWDEASAYRFSLQQVEDDIEDPATELHAMCRQAVAEVCASGEMMSRLGIPEAHHALIADSWQAREPELYGRFDLVYDGTGPAKMIEYNADTPTALYESAAFQWRWLEDQIAAGVLPEGADQFNRIHEAIVERFEEIFATGAHVHFTSAEGVEEDYATVEQLAWAAREADLGAHYTALEKIGVSESGQFADDEDRVIGALFKLYPWEDLLRDPFADHIAGAHCRFLEPPWKALVSNKGLLPVLWQMFEGHPNLLPAFFAEDADSDAARAALGDSHVRKPIFSREGAGVRITRNGALLEEARDRSYDAHPVIVQGYAPLPEFSGMHPIIGAWIVGESCVGMGLREDRSRITQDLSRFKAHFISA